MNKFLNKERPINFVFKMTIGDWSRDGHSQYEEYIISSNKSKIKVREIHYKIKEKLGIDIHEICADYEENLLSFEIYDKLKQLGFNNWSDDEELLVYPEDMIKLWMFLLMKVDPTLTLKIQPFDNFHFYGLDHNGRHIDQVGYGCFIT